MALDDGTAVTSGKKVVKAAISMPPDENLRLLEMEDLAMKAGLKVTLSQICRAALQLLYEVEPADRLKLIAAVQTFSPGPPKGAPRKWSGVRRPRVPGLPSANE
jgi:hypothetical protein